MKKCAFCDARAVEKGGEHLWDDWLNKKMPKRRYDAKKRLSLHSPLIEYPVRGLNEKLPAVCTKCNSEWMSALTEKMKECFSEAILDGAPFSLALRNAHFLAAFTLMKAIVKDHCYGDDPFFTRAARERLRTSLAIPDFVKMWFAAHEGARYGFRSGLYIVAPDMPGPLYGMEFLSYTYVVGNLALQLLAPRWKDIRHRGRPLVTLTPHSYWQPAAIQFWPFAGTDHLSWPPEKVLGDSVIEKFINRFQVPIKIPR